MPSSEHMPGRGLTEQELQVASFWVRNQASLRRLGYSALIGVNILLWLFVSWSLLDAYAISYPRESRIIPFIAQNNLSIQSLEATAPKPLESTNVTSLNATEGRKDFLAEIINPNPQWWAEFDYRFNLGEENTPTQHGFALPNNPGYLSELGFRVTSSTGVNAQLEVENIRWHRILPQNVERDYTAFQEKRLQLKTEDVTYKNEVLVGDKMLGQSSFTLVNDSAFGYWDVDLTIVLLRAGSPIAVSKLSVKELKSGERRPITLNWGESITGVNETEIRPSINIMDAKSYLPTQRF